MKAVERQLHSRVLSTWETLLRRLEKIGPASDDPEDLDGYGNVKDYILDRIEEKRRLLGLPS